MNNSNVREHLDAKHKQDHQQRIEGIKRWVEYIKSEDPDTWGPQQNALVNDQLDAAQSVSKTASQRQRVTEIAEEIIEESGNSGEDSA